MLDWKTSELIIEGTLSSARKLRGAQAADLILQTACEEKLEKKITPSRKIMDVVKVSPPELPDFWRRTVSFLQDLKKRKQYLGLIFERYADDILGLMEIARKSNAVNTT